MVSHINPSEMPLPTGWSRRAKLAMLHVLSLAQYATAYTRGWAADSRSARLRLRAQNEQLRQAVALLKEELRIKDERMRRSLRTSGHTMYRSNACPFSNCALHVRGPSRRQPRRFL